VSDGTLDHVLWIGGMGGIGKTTAARSIARRYDLQLYSVDAHTHEHRARLPPEPERSLDEIWVESAPEELARWFNDVARQHFPLIVSDLNAFPQDVPVIAEGPQLLPELVAPLVASRGAGVGKAAHAKNHRLGPSHVCEREHAGPAEPHATWREPLRQRRVPPP
jgi:hypothetical protein